MGNARTEAPIRLVVIDDDPALTALVTTIARESYPDARELAIDPFVGAEDAIEVLRWMGDRGRGEALIVISDFHLPPSPIDGLDVLDVVGQRLPGAKRVLMTGRDPAELAPRLDEAGLDAFVQKPFMFPEMQGVIGRLVSEIKGARP